MMIIKSKKYFQFSTITIACVFCLNSYYLVQNSICKIVIMTCLCYFLINFYLQILFFVFNWIKRLFLFYINIYILSFSYVKYLLDIIFLISLFSVFLGQGIKQSTRSANYACINLQLKISPNQWFDSVT